MEAMDIQALVTGRSGENERFELKSGTADIAGAVATLTAFANDYEGREAPPFWRNPSLAAFLLRLGLAQREGQGLRTILDEAERIGAPIPEIIGTDVDFTVKLPAFRRRLRAPERADIGSTDALVLVSIGGPSLLAAVAIQRGALGLAEARVVVDVALPGYVGSPEAWAAEAEQIRQEIKDHVDDPEIRRFHLFYRGPVVLAPLLGALIAPAKPLWLYHHENGEYRLAYVLDKRFLVGST